MQKSPRKRSWPSLKRSARSKALRHAVGLKNGRNPSATSIKPSAPSAKSQNPAPTYFFAPGAAGAGAALPRIALKNSLDGSTTMTSLLLRKLARYASRLR